MEAFSAFISSLSSFCLLNASSRSLSRFAHASRSASVAFGPGCREVY